MDTKYITNEAIANMIENHPDAYADLLQSMLMRTF